MTQKTGNDCGNSLYLVCYQLMPLSRSYLVMQVWCGGIW